MSKKVKIAILRARHDTSLPFISDQACTDILITNATHHSLLNYWSFNTYGYLDFIGSAIFPWVDISIMASDVSRGTQIKKAYDATKAIENNNVDDFDGYFVITYPGRMTIPNPKAGQPNEPATKVLNFDGGEAGTVVNGKRACAIPVMPSDHTFMCHELGHVLGFKHSYGVMNNGIEWDGKPPFDEGLVYGDPYDIMSSASFGTRNLDPKKTKYYGSPIFAGPSHPQWPVEPKINMGPATARAQVHLWDAAAIPAARIRHLQTPGGTGAYRTRLYAASSNGSPHLIIVHPANEDQEGRNRCYIEFRDNKGWDKGMDTYGSDLARQGVVVHTLADTSEGVRCWYRGHIPVPVEIDSDLQITGTPLVVRVTDDDVDAGYVEIEISTINERGFDLDITRNNDVVTMVDTHEMGTPCGDTIVYGTLIMQSLYFYRAITYGYGGEGAPDAAPPAVKWKVGGIDIGVGSGSINVVASGEAYTIDYSTDGVTQELSLSSKPAEKYIVSVQVTVSESNGANPITVTTVFDPVGYYNGFGPGDGEKLARCMDKYLIYVKVRPRDILIPPGPEPYREQWKDRINKARLQEVVRLISDSHPAEAIALGALVIMRYGNNISSQQTKTETDFQKALKTVAAIAAICITFAVLANVLKSKRTLKRNEDLEYMA
ncbi:MAG: hypothetical protein ABJA71_03130 [Ginsengibacter sp.]